MIDCDVHVDFCSSQELVPYIDPNFRDHLVRGELPGPGAMPAATRAWPHPEGPARRDAFPENGVAGSEITQRHFVRLRNTLHRRDPAWQLHSGRSPVWMDNNRNIVRRIHANVHICRIGSVDKTDK